MLPGGPSAKCRARPLKVNRESEINFRVIAELKDAFDGNERIVALVMGHRLRQVCVP
jgi:hypothetical protein